MLGFVCLNFITSSTYLFNDIIDINYDRLHFFKKNRPIASGQISIIEGILYGMALIIVSFYSLLNFYSISIIKYFLFYIIISYLC